MVPRNPRVPLVRTIGNLNWINVLNLNEHELNLDKIGFK